MVIAAVFENVVVPQGVGGGVAPGVGVTVGGGEGVGAGVTVGVGIGVADGIGEGVTLQALGPAITTVLGAPVLK